MSDIKSTKNNESTRLLATQNKLKSISNILIAVVIVVALVAIGAIIIGAMAISSTARFQGDLNAINTSLQSIKDNQNNLSVDVSKLKNTVGGESTEKILQDIEDLSGKVGTLQTTFETLKNQASGANAAVSSLQNSMSKLQSEVSEQSVKVEKLVGTVTATSKEINTAVNTATTVLNNLKREISAADSTRDALSQEASKAKDDLAQDVNNAKAELNKVLTSAKNDLAQDVNNARNELDQKIQQANSVVDRLSKDINTASKLIDQMKTGVVDNLKVNTIEFMMPEPGGNYSSSGMGLAGGPGLLQIIGTLRNGEKRVVGFYKFADGVKKQNNVPGNWFVGDKETINFKSIVEKTCKPHQFC